MLIIRNDVRPESNIYYLGAMFLIKYQKHKEFKIDDFFMVVCADFPSISINQILYTLDWLYLLNKVELLDEGLRIKCD